MRLSCGSGLYRVLTGLGVKGSHSLWEGLLVGEVASEPIEFWNVFGTLSGTMGNCARWTRQFILWPLLFLVSCEIVSRCPWVKRAADGVAMGVSG